MMFSRLFTSDPSSAAPVSRTTSSSTARAVSETGSDDFSHTLADAVEPAARKPVDSASHATAVNDKHAKHTNHADKASEHALSAAADAAVVEEGGEAAGEKSIEKTAEKESPSLSSAADSDVGTTVNASVDATVEALAADNIPTSDTDLALSADGASAAVDSQQAMQEGDAFLQEMAQYQRQLTAVSGDLDVTAAAGMEDAAGKMLPLSSPGDVESTEIDVESEAELEGEPVWSAVFAPTTQHGGGAETPVEGDNIMQSADGQRAASALTHASLVAGTPASSATIADEMQRDSQTRGIPVDLSSAMTGDTGETPVALDTLATAEGVGGVIGMGAASGMSTDDATLLTAVTAGGSEQETKALLAAFGGDDAAEGVRAAHSASPMQAMQTRLTDPAAANAQSPLLLTQAQGGDELADRLQMMLSKNLKHVDIRLDPPELGRLQIRLSINNDQANVQFTAANPQTRELIEQAMPRLRELLSQQGVQLAQTSVQQESSRQFAGQQSQHDQAQQGQGNGQGNGRQGDASGAGPLAGEHGSDVMSPQDFWLSQAKAGVDYYA